MTATVLRVFKANHMELEVACTRSGGWDLQFRLLSGWYPWAPVWFSGPGHVCSASCLGCSDIASSCSWMAWVLVAEKMKAANKVFKEEGIPAWSWFLIPGALDLGAAQFVGSEAGRGLGSEALSNPWSLKDGNHWPWSWEIYLKPFWKYWNRGRKPT